VRARAPRERRRGGSIRRRPELRARVGRAHPRAHQDERVDGDGDGPAARSRDGRARRRRLLRRARVDPGGPMTQPLPQGTILQADGGDSRRELDLLGAGGQGEVYAVDQSAARYALKWYYPPPRDPRAQAQAQEQRAALRDYILPKGPPDARFVWPLAFVEGAA